MIVADASVVLKWFFPDERDHEAALVLKERHLTGEEVITAPEFLAYEVSNILMLKQKNSKDAVAGFLSFCAAGIQLEPSDASQLVRAMELAHRYKTTVYDSCYVALAQTFRCRFVTADERLLADLKGVPQMVHLKEAAK